MSRSTACEFLGKTPRQRVEQTSGIPASRPSCLQFLLEPRIRRLRIPDKAAASRMKDAPTRNVTRTTAEGSEIPKLLMTILGVHFNSHPKLFS